VILLERTRARVVLAEVVIGGCLVLTGNLSPRGRRTDESAYCEVHWRAGIAVWNGGGVCCLECLVLYLLELMYHVALACFGNNNDRIGCLASIHTLVHESGSNIESHIAISAGGTARPYCPSRVNTVSLATPILAAYR